MIIYRALIGPILKFARRLRFPTLFAVVVAMLGIDLLVPDLVPFIDEIVLGLLTVLIGSIKSKMNDDQADQGTPGKKADDDPTIIDV